MIQGQLQRLANIFDNVGQVVLASVVLPGVLSIERFDLRFATIGTLAMLISWWLSLRLERIAGGGV